MRRLGVILLALGAVGCGGSDDEARPASVTRAAWAGQARAICRRAEAESKRMAAALKHLAAELGVPECVPGQAKRT